MTPFSFSPFNEAISTWTEVEPILSNIRNEYGGEIALLPGDVVSYGSMTNARIAENLGGTMSTYDSVYTAAVNCYRTTRELFRRAGYENVVAVVGDHELGGNRGFHNNPKITKLPTISAYRQAFVDGFHKKETTGRYIFDDFIGDVQSTPVGTPYEGSSYAMIYKNVLFVSVDAFRVVGNGRKHYIDRENGYGGEGAITCDVSGDHLLWFEDILKVGKRDDSIKHVFVQAHLPIIQPVRKVDTSGQFFDGGEESDFWKLMNEYDVDVYFAGEVHSTTASKTKEASSNLIQVVTRSVRFSGFLTVHISDDTIQIEHYNEVGKETMNNNKYVKDGHIKIDKTFDEVHIEANGELELIDEKSPLIHFDFEEITQLGTRQILGLDGEDTLMAKEVDIDGIKCVESFENNGSFGKQYDAQVANIEKQPSRLGGGFAGHFDGNNSRFAIYGVGPFGGGQTISVSLWFKADRNDSEMILMYYGSTWGNKLKTEKDFILISLDRGIPAVYGRHDRTIRTSGISDLANGLWHHVAVVMPKPSCRFSELQIFVNGKKAATESTSSEIDDQHLFFLTPGKLSFGGLGYASSGAYEQFANMIPFRGMFDDLSVWSVSLGVADISKLSERMNGKQSKKKINIHYGRKCKIPDPMFSKEMSLAKTSPNQCRLKCKHRKSCLGFQAKKQPFQCMHFSVIPEIDETLVDDNLLCGQVSFLSIEDDVAFVNENRQAL